MLTCLQQPHLNGFVIAQLISCANKTNPIVQNSKLENSDFLLITKTWHADSDEDKACIATNPLDNGENKLLQENRQNKHGGGIARLHNHYPTSACSSIT